VSAAPRPSAPGRADAAPVVSLRGAALAFGDRVLWDGLDLDIHAGEYFAVLGGNGTGKTSFLKVLLGLLPLSAGTAEILGEPPRRGSGRIGYVPQQRSFAAATPLRARDLVGLGVDGHRWGVRLRTRAHRRRVDELLELVGAGSYADAPVGALSGGEQQRLRVAQSIAADPRLLLCDEALLSLDLHHQHAVSGLVDEQRRRTGAAVVFVTHEINPIIDHVDRILYLAGGRFRIGTPDEVLRSDVLSELYATRIDVVRTGGRVVVVGHPDSSHHTDEDQEAAL
jgi:zinc/manganese transport system ATP-binding protein